MPSKIRLQRISDRIRNEMSSMLLMEVQDPRLSGVSITDVRVDRELAYADVYVSAVEGHERSKEILDGLHSAAGFLRKELAARVELRVFPRLRFHWDPTPERADHIEKVLAELRENDPSLSEGDPSLATTSHPENTEPPGEITEDETNGDDE
jgi:ribosome-binding factor A